MADTRKTSYAVIVYEDSTDMLRLRAVLMNLHLPCAISPRHDHDVYDESDVLAWEKRHKHLGDGSQDDVGIDPWESSPVVGALKKPHYHVVISFGTQKKSRQQVLDVVHEFNPNINYVIPLYSLSGYVRYLCHLDDRDRKYVYDPHDVEGFGHIDLSPLWSVNKAEKASALDRVCDWVTDYQIWVYCDLVDVARNLEDPSVFETVADKSFFLSKYCEQKYQQAQGLAPESCDVKAIAKAIREGKDYAPPVVGFSEVA